MVLLDHFANKSNTFCLSLPLLLSHFLLGSIRIPQSMVPCNVFGGTLVQVGTGLFNLGCFCWDYLEGVKIFLVELLVRWERGFSTWDVYVGIVWCWWKCFFGNRGKVGKGLFNLRCLWWTQWQLDYFLLRCSTHPGEVVAVTGSSSILGSWQKDKVRICSSVHIWKILWKILLRWSKWWDRVQKTTSGGSILVGLVLKSWQQHQGVNLFQTNVESLNI